MMRFEFNKCNKLSVGVELELTIVDKVNNYPTRKFDKIAGSIDDEFKKYIHPEFFQSMMEISSPILSHIDGIHTFLRKIFNNLITVGDRYDLNIIALGIHPLLKNEDTQVTENARYKELFKELQEILRRFIINGMHIHIGLPSEKAAIKAFNLTNYYLPLFLALSTSSPFHEGKFTGLHSYRNKIFETLPRGGIAEYIEHYDEFIDSINRLYLTGYIKSYNDIWWDTRIRPDFGTIELRVCDAINSIERIQAIAAMLQALCLYARDNYVSKHSYLISKQNKWNAERYSLDGEFITNDGDLISIRDLGKKLLNNLRSLGIFSELSTEHYIDVIDKYLYEPSISQKMIAGYKKNGSLKDAVIKGIIS